eukprot:14521775-Alexandrium_andersonii.AAC.1
MEVVPGVAVEALIRAPGEEARETRVMSVYLAPDSRAEALAALQAADPPTAPPSLVVGDINIQLTHPRDAAETRDA